TKRHLYQVFITVNSSSIIRVCDWQIGSKILPRPWHIGRKLYRSIEAYRARINRFEDLRRYQIRIPYPRLGAVFPPKCCCLEWSWKQSHAINNQNGSPVNSDIVFVLQDSLNITDESQIGFLTVVLRNEDFLVLTIPAPRPVLIGPANAKGKINFRIGHEL